MSEIKPFSAVPFVTLPLDFDTAMGSYLAAMYEQYGPIIRARRWEEDVVYLIGPEANRFVMTTNRLRFSHKEGWGRMMGVLELFGDGLLTMDGAEHAQHRRMMNPAFAISYMDRYLPMMNRIIRARIDDWATHGEVDIYDEMRKITFDVAAEALGGLQAGPEVDRFREIYVSLLNLGGIATSPEDFTAQLRELWLELRALLLPKIHERRETPTDDVLGMLVRARDEEGHSLSDEQLIAHANILFVAGHETSTSLSSWLLYLLTQHPEYRARVIEEQRLLFDDLADPTLEQIKQMRVLHNALSEAERLYPPVPNGPRGVVESFDFAGYHVPVGTSVLYSIAACHRIPSIFAEPDRFDPDRFASPREEDRKTPYSLVGFGGGPRICIGINFAQVEIKAMISHLLRRYDFALVPGQQIVQVYGATGWPLEGIRMRVTEQGS